jgi:4'-phosphopantetheinyl transferase
MLPVVGLSREVRVRFVRSDAYADAMSWTQAQSILDANEREALSRLRPLTAWRDYLAAHTLVRTMLAEEVRCDPSRLRFRSTPRGRSEVIAPAGARRLQFSLAHADGLALCAVANGNPVGADVESLRHVGPELIRMGDVICSEGEVERLRALPPSTRAEGILCTWTLKEAALKAAGLGEQFPPARLEVHREGGGAGVEFYVGTLDDVPHWRLALFRLAPHHVAAVAMRAESSGSQVAVQFEAA